MQIGLSIVYLFMRLPLSLRDTSVTLTRETSDCAVAFHDALRGGKSLQLRRCTTHAGVDCHTIREVARTLKSE
eukprot:scaffold630577_cov17-Prasinocladus_malaysianus.AAC.1